MHISRILIIVAIIVVIFNFYLQKTNVEYKKQIITIKDIIDGDTVKTKNESIRLVGINTPEKNMPNWKLSKNYLKRLIGKNVFLVWFDKKYDRYKRRLGYIFYNKTNINKKLVELGYGHTYYVSKDPLTEELKNAENTAIKKESGIWKKSNKSKCMIMNIFPKKEYVVITNDCNFSINTCGWTLKDEATHIFYFPCLNLTKTITVYSKNENKAKWSFNKKYVWNNDNDKAFLRDKTGRLITYKSI